MKMSSVGNEYGKWKLLHENGEINKMLSYCRETALQGAL